MSDSDQNPTQVALFTPLVLRGVTLKNRIGLSPMCQYCAEDGLPNDWHLVHLASRAVGGAGLVLTEATAVVPEGRISPWDLGLWNDAQQNALARIAAAVKSLGAVPGVQLAHAGRKAACSQPWAGGHRLDADSGGWDTMAPSPLPFRDDEPAPLALDQAGIEALIQAFATAARRAVDAGFEVVEMHAAHGYLLHQFLSPLTNRRDDAWGGSLENRMRLPLACATAMRAALPDETPLLVRVSATDWAEGGWDLDQTVALARALKPLGVDLMDVSTGGLLPHAHIPVAPLYQVPFAKAVRESAGLPTAAVGLITEPEQAESVIASGQADLALLGRTLLREPYWPLKARLALGLPGGWPLQYQRGAPKGA
ncbi:NADH:flavin oxidoreductase/NADH oxidase [Fundidesulfovibrio butyratiphilus]